MFPFQFTYMYTHTHTHTHTPLSYHENLISLKEKIYKRQKEMEKNKIAV